VLRAQSDHPFLWILLETCRPAQRRKCWEAGRAAAPSLPADYSELTMPLANRDHHKTGKLFHHAKPTSNKSDSDRSTVEAAVASAIEDPVLGKISV
jgi:hypothetical protein